MNIEDFVARDAYGWLLTRDYKKILALSDEDFAQLHLELMRGYNWWNMNVKPDCWECSKSIERPEDLRRYYGQNLHPPCFRQVNKNDAMRKQRPRREQQYWERLATLRYA